MVKVNFSILQDHIFKDLDVIVAVVCGLHASAALTTLTLRSLTLYIYMEHLFLMFLDHTQRRSTVGRTPLDE